VFLDEVGDMALGLQAKLLRAVQSGEILPVGAALPEFVHVRYVAATSRDLDQLAEEGSFRRDLLYRLNVVRLKVPPLRNRLEDLPALTEHLTAVIARQYGRERIRIEPEALDALASYTWPGNVRELENVLRRACALMEGTEIGLQDLPAEIMGGDSPLPSTPTTGTELMRLRRGEAARAVEAVERRFVEHVLTHAGGNVAQAARDARVSRAFLYKLLKRLGVDPDHFKT
jgi:DNA-binding NtrC family response regulator